MKANNKERLQQTLQTLLHLDLTDLIAADVTAVEMPVGGGGYSDVFLSELSADWRTRYDPNVIRLLERENGTLVSILKPQDSEIAGPSLAAASVTFGRTK